MFYVSLFCIFCLFRKQKVSYNNGGNFSKTFKWLLPKKYTPCLTLSWRRPPPYRNQSIDLLYKLMDWFLYERNPSHESAKRILSKVFVILLTFHLFNPNSSSCMKQSTKYSQMHLHFHWNHWLLVSIYANVSVYIHGKLIRIYELCLQLLSRNQSFCSYFKLWYGWSNSLLIQPLLGIIKKCYHKQSDECVL